MLVLDVVVVARVRLGALAVNERALKAANEAHLKGDREGVVMVTVKVKKTTKNKTVSATRTIKGEEDDDG